MCEALMTESDGDNSTERISVIRDNFATAHLNMEVRSVYDRPESGS